MAYTSTNKFTDHFKTLQYSGDGNSPRSLTGVGFQSDLLWIKNRNGANTYEHRLMDSVRGSNKVLHSSNNAAESSEEYYTVSSFDSDGWTGRNGTGSNQSVTGGNDSGYDFVAWNFLAGGTSPSKTYAVTVVSDGGNKYRFDGYGTSAVTLDLQEGGTYTFDQSDSSNSGHPLRFYTASDKTGGEYTTGVTTNGTPGSSGAYTRITVAASAPTLYYQCSAHSGMGGQANTNTTHGSSNFDGTYQSLVSANVTAGFSVVKFTGTGSNGSVGHGLDAAPEFIAVKNLGSTTNWTCYHKNLGTGKYIQMNTTTAPATASGYWATVDAYCFTSKPGYCKVGHYYGNSNVNGTFVYTGFRPEFMVVRTTASSNWALQDGERQYENVSNHTLAWNTNGNEANFGGGENVFGSGNKIDLVSNGYKIREASGYNNNDNVEHIYIALGQSIVGSNNVPNNAR
jgi:hypothetical protein